MDVVNQHLESLPRVLVVEPDPVRRQVYRDTLGFPARTEAAFLPMRAQHPGSTVSRGRLEIDLTVCARADEALAPVREAAEHGRPFAVVFIDAGGARAGEELGARIRQIDPLVEMVLVAVGEIVDMDALGERLTPSSKLVVLSHALRGFEVEQLARALIAKWNVERQLRCSEARLSTSQRIGGVGIWEWNLRTGKARWNPPFATLFGLPQSASSGPVDHIWERIHPDDRVHVHCEMGRIAHERGSVTLEYRIALPGAGERKIRQESVASVGDAEGGVWAVSAVQDMTEREGVEGTLRSLAYFDPLTRLPNRSFAVEFLHTSLVLATRHARSCALLHVNLDGFKRINDTLGHSAGDLVLREVAARMEGCVRMTEGRGRMEIPDQGSAFGAVDTVARFGADEFVVVLPRVSGPADARRVGERILEQLSSPVSLQGRDVTISASIGIALFPEHAQDEDLLLRNSALAMQRAKRRGRNTCECYEPELGEIQSMDRLNLEAGLRQALACDALALHFQPKVTPDGLRLAGAEALLRWNHDELGMIPPTMFIPIAEETGIILPLGEWVIRTVCAQIASWRREGRLVVPVSVNVSAQQLQDHSLVEKIRGALRETGVSPDELEFEITESVLMGETGAGDDPLAQLRAMGSTVSMDDFGTGYSSLSYLKRLPIDVVKIDRSFVQDILVDEDDQAILRAIITMAHQLKLRIVAEGVESQEQLELLRSMECDLIQGYVVSRPVDAATFAQRFLDSQERKAG
jgi:predicted signal transduction protein with EAL and GGDEF domain